MAQTHNELVLGISARANLKSFKRVIKQLQTMKKESVQINHTFKNMKQAQVGLGDITRKEVAGAFKKARKEATRFRGELLSIMFFGMAITRVIGGFYRASTESFNKIAEGTDLANNGFTRMKAAWEFFKFSFINALLGSPVIQSLINWAIQMIDKFSAMSDTTKVVLGVLLAIGFAFGSLIMTVGLVGLGIIGLKQAMILFGLATTDATGKLILLGVATTKLSILGTILGWVSGVLSVIVVLALLWKKFGSFGKAIKAWASAIVLAIALVIQGVIDAILSAISLVLTAISRMIQRIASALAHAGFEKTANTLMGLSQAIDKFQRFGLHVDVVGAVSQGLNNIGFNPKPASSGGNTTYNINQTNNYDIESDNPTDIMREINAAMKEQQARFGNSTYV